VRKLHSNLILLLNIAQNIVSGAYDVSISAAIPITGSPSGREITDTSGGSPPGTTRKFSFQSSIGSPPARSFQDRLFQRSPSHLQLTNQNGSLDDLYVLSKIPSRSPRSSTNMESKPHGKTPQSSNLKHSKMSTDVVTQQQQKPPSNASEQFQKGPPRNSKQMTKAERRELQERQRAEKAANKAATGGINTSGPLKQSKSGTLGSQISISETNLTSITRQLSSSKIVGPVSSAGKKQYKKAQLPDPKAGKVVSLFSHLSQYDSEINLTREKNAKGTIHPIVIQLGIQYSENMITGGNARCMALMFALKKVIMDFIPPPGTALLRTLTQHISKQVDYLSNSRSLATSMKTAIRYVKNEITTLDVSLPDEDVIVLEIEWCFN
jgi:translation initiation factor eIF-2B subunit delta